MNDDCGDKKFDFNNQDDDDDNMMIKVPKLKIINVTPAFIAALPT